jgi:hypothetical protein
MTYYPGIAIGLVFGPDRRRVLRDFTAVTRRPRIGSMLRWSDPLPSMALIASSLRNPSSLVRPYLPEGALAIARRVRRGDGGS